MGKARIEENEVNTSCHAKNLFPPAFWHIHEAWDQLDSLELQEESVKHIDVEPSHGVRVYRAKLALMDEILLTGEVRTFARMAAVQGLFVACHEERNSYTARFLNALDLLNQQLFPEQVILVKRRDGTKGVFQVAEQGLDVSIVYVNRNLNREASSRIPRVTVRTGNATGVAVAQIRDMYSLHVSTVPCGGVQLFGLRSPGEIVPDELTLLETGFEHDPQTAGNQFIIGNADARELAHYLK